jgi:acetoin utilization deacetylase AcuC-like enzyme
MLENGVRILELRLLELACGVDIYQELSREDVDELLEIHKEEVVEKCYEIANREIEVLLDSIKHENKVNECEYVEGMVARAYRECDLSIIYLLDWVFDLRMYC